jgi:hypothetical protein
MLRGMADVRRVRPDFGAVPTRPRGGRWGRFVVYVLLLALACGAIWWIDRGAMLSNGNGATTATRGMP